MRQTLRWASIRLPRLDFGLVVTLHGLRGKVTQAEGCMKRKTDALEVGFLLLWWIREKEDETLRIGREMNNEEAKKDE